MIRIEFEEKEQVDNLYSQVRDIILSKSNNRSFNYQKKQHYLYEENEWPGISEDYYNESGTIEFENVNDETIVIEIDRWHPHRHNGYSGLNAIPCLSAIIYVKNADNKQVLWKLEVSSGTLHYKAEVTSLEIPRDDLREKGEEEKVQEAIGDEMKMLETRISERYKNASNRYIAASKEKEALLLDREEKIAKSIEEIMLAYSTKLDQCDSAISQAQAEINSYDSLVSKFSALASTNRTKGNGIDFSGQQLVKK